MKIPFTKNQDEITLKVFVKTGSKTPGVEGVEEDRVRIRVRSKPIDGEANSELIEIISEFFKVPKSKIEIVKGATSRNKIIKIRGIKID